VIVRILGEGQWDVPDEELDELNRLDDAVEQAVDGGDEAAFAQSLAALLGAVRQKGDRLEDDALQDSDLILPPADASVSEVRELLADDGLIPG
jgi:hypothetical protein